MNRKITNKIILIIPIFLILSSSLFANWAHGWLLVFFGGILAYGFLTVIPFIIIIAIINFILRKRNLKTRLTANIIMSVLWLFTPAYATVILIIIEAIIIIVLLIKKDDIKKHSDYYALIRVSDNIEGLKLLENGVDINATDKEGWTALIHASKNGYLEMVKLLVENGADVNIKNNEGKTALEYASDKGYLEIVKYLKMKDINYKSETDLIKFSYSRNLEGVKYLIEKGEDVNAKDKDGRTALIHASKNGYLEMVKLLVKNGADINAKDNYGWSALILASDGGHFEVVKYLIENGANVNIQYEHGETALICAAAEGYLKIVKFLIENGANIRIKNNDGKTALDLAETEEIKEVLRKAETK